jgi:hypothetical protein
MGKFFGVQIDIRFCVTSGSWTILREGGVEKKL